MPVSAHDIAAVLRARQPELPTKKLHKLLYYCQGHHLAVFGEPLFSEAIDAWDMGPVVSALWRAERHGTPPPAPSELGEAELNTIGYTLSRYGALTGKDLGNLTHSEDPWLSANRGRSSGGSARIEHDVIARYFRDNASTQGEEGTLDRALVSKWLRETTTKPQGPSRVDSLEALRAKRDAIAAGLASGG